jgi:flagellar basal-body rod modification protein FlgD
MTDVSSVSSATTASLTGTTTGSDELGKNEFLQLLVAQMQYQDPLEPMSNSDFVAQLAQFSNVEQLQGVNEGINLLGVQQMGMTNAQASSFIGKEVEVKSNEFTVAESDTAAHAAFTLADDATTVTVEIRDAEGNVVRTLDLDAQSEGEVQIDWDLLDDNGNKADAGTYTIDVSAADADGNTVSWESSVRGVVTGVSYENGYPELQIGDVSVMLSDILGVYPAADETTSGEGTEG